MSSTLSTDQIYEGLREALISLGADEQRISPEATFEELEVDSLDLVELAQIVEERFGVTIKGSDVAKIATVGQAAEWISERA
jgi:acyl carrier protein